MRDLTPNEMGSLLFKIRDDLESIAKNLSDWRMNGRGTTNMVPISVLVAETKVVSAISDVEDLIQLLAKVSSNYTDKY